MKQINFLLILLNFVVLVACAAGTKQKSEDFDDGGGDNLYPPPTEGGPIAGPNQPTNSIPTTTGGHISILSVKQYTIDSVIKIIGSVYAQQKTTMLFERSASSSMIFWDVYQTDTNNNLNLICTFIKPVSSSAKYQGLTHNGSDYLVFGYSSNYPYYARLFKINFSNCSASLYIDMYQTNSYSFYSMSLSYYSGSYFHIDGNYIKQYKISTGLLENWSYSSQEIAGAAPSPVRSNYSVDEFGRTWFIDVNERLWKGSLTTGMWSGWTELPTEVYLDFIYTKFINTVDNNKIHVITQYDYGTQLRIYLIDVGGF